MGPNRLYFMIHDYILVCIMGTDLKPAPANADFLVWLEERKAEIVTMPLTPEEIEINAHWERIHKAFDKRG